MHGIIQTLVGVLFQTGRKGGISYSKQANLQN